MQTKLLTYTILTLIVLLAARGNRLYAQNTGPIAPEAVAFEPVDATDMVNLLTGDFSYVLPIIDIPGPGGGYQMALSYHGGIVMDQEASWVGLGWSINPGAINRSVNGLPDDWKHEELVSVIKGPSKTFEYHTVSAGVGFKMGLSIGLSYSWGDFKSFGGSVGYGPQGSNLSGNLSYNTRSGLGVGVGLKGLGGENAEMAGKLGLSISRSGLGVSAGFYDKVGDSGMGISLSSNSISGSFRANGIGSSVSVATNAISSDDFLVSESGFYIPINVKLFYFSYGHRKIKYWLYKELTKFGFGSLYASDSYFHDTRIDEFSGVQLGEYLMDSYYVNESDRPDKERENWKESTNAMLMMSSDSYQVSGQGIGGGFSPKLFDYGLLTENSYDIEKDDSDILKEVLYFSELKSDWKLSTSGKSIYYSFDNLNESYMRISNGEIKMLGNDLSTDVVWEGGNLVTENVNGDSNTVLAKKRQGGGTVIEWFTNHEIENEPAECAKRGFINSDDVDRISQIRNPDHSHPEGYACRSCFVDIPLAPDGIGAYTIFALDGKMYHYSIPVYQHEEFIRDNEISKDSYFEKRKFGTYATHWLLTAITGPDYVDNNSDGDLNEGDLGYWVKFNYGKWSDGYMWQYPNDLGDDTYETYDDPIMWGRKQIYYLNSVSTSTHTAYFIKELRKDGLGYQLNYEDSNVSFKGIVGPLPEEMADDYGNRYLTNCTKTQLIQVSANENVEPLCLKKIVLVKNNCNLSNKGDVKLKTGKRGSLKLTSEYEGAFLGGDRSKIKKFEEVNEISYNSYYSDNVLDMFDIGANQNELLEREVIKEIDFNYNYSLCKMTPNSSAIDKGKLTLNSIQIKGAKGACLLPPYIFDYQNAGIDTYDKDRRDLWGYDKVHPDNWSLKSITTPTGGKIHVEYESDEYSKEVMRSPKGKFPIKSGSSSQLKVGGGLNDDRQLVREIDVIDNSGLKIYNMKLSFDEDYDLSKIAKLNENIVTYIPYEVHINNGSGLNGGERIEYGMLSGTTKVTNLSGNTISIDLEEVLYYAESNEEGFNEPSEIYARIKFDEGYIVGNNYHYSGKGGGLRVNQIQTEDENGNLYSTNYNYNNPANNSCSGLTIFAPAEDNPYFDNVPFASELPAPGVIYEYVTVSNNDGNSNTTYQFNVYEDYVEGSRKHSLGEQFIVEDLKYNSGQATVDGSVNLRSATITDNLVSVGRLKRKYSWNSAGDKLKEIRYNYKSLAEMNWGITQETFRYHKMYRSRRKVGSSIGIWYNNIFLNSTSKINYPSVIKSTESETASFKSSSIIEKRDLNTGIPLLKKDINALNEEFITETVPAYTKYSGMGSKIKNPNNKNMLSQETASYQYKLVGGQPKLLSAGIQTWEDNWVYREQNSNGSYSDESVSGIWRKNKSFAWKGDLDTDGAYSGFDDFEWGSSDTCNKGNGWQKTSEVTRYSAFSAPLESKDINGNYGATRYDKDGLNVIASIGNAKWEEFTASGFENIDAFGSYWGAEGELQIVKTSAEPMISASVPVEERDGFSAITGIDSHTGKYYLKCTGEVQILCLNELLVQAPRSYRVSCWVHKNSSASTQLKFGYSPWGTHDVTWKSGGVSKSFGNWDLMTLDVILPSEHQEFDALYVKISSSGVAYIDDFRIHPIDAPMSAYVYDNKTDALTAILDGENIATKYSYDAGGRLKKVEKETPSGFKLVSENDYHYANEIVDEEPHISNFTVSPILDNRSSFFYRVNLGYQLSGGTAAEYCLSLDDNFIGNNYWYSYQGNITTSIPLGSHTVYFKVRNILGQESNVVSAEAYNAFSLSVNWSTYLGDDVSGTVSFPNKDGKDANDLTYRIYQSGNLIKTVVPTFSYATSSTNPKQIISIEGDPEAELLLNSENFKFTSSGLGIGSYNLVVSDDNGGASRSDDFSIRTRPVAPVSPSCSAIYNDSNATLSVSWSHFPCNVNIYLDGNRVGYGTSYGGSGTSTPKVLQFSLGSSHSVRVECVSSSTQAFCKVRSSEILPIDDRQLIPSEL